MEKKTFILFVRYEISGFETTREDAIDFFKEELQVTEWTKKGSICREVDRWIDSEQYYYTSMKGGDNNVSRN